MPVTTAYGTVTDDSRVKFLSMLSKPQLVQMVMLLVDQHPEIKSTADSEIGRRIENGTAKPRSPSPSKGSPTRDPPVDVLEASGRLHVKGKREAKRILACRNGYNAPEVVVRGRSLDELLFDAAEKLSIGAAPKKLFDEAGKSLAFADIKNGMRAWVSLGEPKRAPTDTLPMDSTLKKDSRLLPQPVVRVNVYRNGSDTGAVSVKVQFPNQMLDDATRKLKLPAAARKFYTQDGKKVESIYTLTSGQAIYASVGEPFKDPDSKPAVEPTKISIEADSRLLGKPTLVLHARRNGHAADPPVKIICPAVMKNLLFECSEKLNVNATTLFDEDGKEISNINDLKREQDVFVGQGEPFMLRLPSLMTEPISPDSTLLPKSPPAFFVEVLPNGANPRDGPKRVLVDGSWDDIRMRITKALDLPSFGKRLFDDGGVEVFSGSELKKGKLYFVSTGVGWVAPTSSSGPPPPFMTTGSNRPSS